MNLSLYFWQSNPRQKYWKYLQNARRLSIPVIWLGVKQNDNTETVTNAIAIIVGTNTNLLVQLLRKAMLK